MGKLMVNVLRLAVVLAVIAGGAAAWMYYSSDELLRAEIVRQLETALPGTTISVERANFDLRGRVRVFDLAVRLPGESRSCLTIAETIITVDRQQLANQQRLVIEQIRVSQPRLRVVREPDGHWNWELVKFVRPAGSGQLPDFELVHGLIEVVLADHATRTMVNVPIDDVMISARPSSQKSYQVDLSLQTEFTGSVRVQGEVPLEPAAWSLTANLAKCRINAETTRLALIAAPQFGAKFTELQQTIARHVPAGAVQTASLTAPSQSVIAPAATPFDLGVSLVGQVQVQVQQPEPTAAPVWGVQVQVLEGELTNAVLPSPLFDLQGAIELEPTQLRVRDLTARNGQSHLKVNTTVSQTGALVVQCDITSLPADEAFLQRLPPSLQRIGRWMKATGTASGQLTLRQAPGAPPKIDAELSLVDGTVQPEVFPYLLHNVSATLSMHDDVIMLDGTGLAGITPVRAQGIVRQPGPANSADFFISANDVPMDDAALKAFPPSLAKVAQSMAFQGRSDIKVRVVRPEGLNQKFQMILDAFVHDAAIQCDVFPYPVTQLSGIVHWEKDVVSFQKLRGYHDGAELRGAGSFQLKPEPARLEMEVVATNAAFDRALFTALPPTLQDVWQAFAPQGEFHAKILVDWTVGGKLFVDVPNVQVKHTEFQLREFPYPFRDLAGRFAYDARELRVDIPEFSARHDDTQISGEGQAQCHTDGTVTVTLNKLHVDDLTPTPTLRRALPKPLRDVVDALNPSGRYSFHGPVTFYGDPSRGGLVAAKWDLQVLLAGCALNAGLRIDDIHGRVQLGGSWTPKRTELQGEIDLDALDALVNHQFTKVKGPFRLHDGILVIGSEQMVNSPKESPEIRVTSDQRITGRAFDGEAALDAVVNLNNDNLPEYRAAMELNNASLEKYAMRHLRGYSSVRGLMNGWMEVRGRGLDAKGMTGEGQMQISPAALYELPVFLQIFQLPQFAPINRTAFDYANFFFRIEDERFNFQTIDLVGNTISLRGRGVVRFDGGVTLDFFTMQPRNQVRLPGLRELVGVVNMVSQGAIAVEVRGPIGAPVARVVPLPAVDEALQQFLGAFFQSRGNPPPAVWRGPPRAAAPRATTLPPESRRQ